MWKEISQDTAYVAQRMSGLQFEVQSPVALEQAHPERLFIDVSLQIVYY